MADNWKKYAAVIGALLSQNNTRTILSLIFVSSYNLLEPKGVTPTTCTMLRTI